MFSQSLYLLSGWAPCRKVSWSFKPWDYMLWYSCRSEIIQVSRQCCTEGASQILKGLEKKTKPNLTASRSCGKTSVCFFNRGPGARWRRPFLPTWMILNFIMMLKRFASRDQSYGSIGSHDKSNSPINNLAFAVSISHVVALYIGWVSS